MGSWLVASAITGNPRDRRLVTLAGIVPDVDALGVVVDVVKTLMSGQEMTFAYYQKFHHLLLHGWPAAVLVALGFAALANGRSRVIIGCLIVFHLHLLLDLLGSRGPTPADLWPICYSEPFFRHPIWFWRGQWKLDGWQSQLVFFGVFGVCLWLAVRRGYSCMEVLSRRFDGVFVNVLRKWAGLGAEKRGDGG